MPATARPTIPTPIIPSATLLSLDHLGPIAFSDGRHIVTLVNADGSDSRVLFTTSSPYDVHIMGGLSWSPDGQFLAYANSTWADIFIISTQDSSTQNITNTGNNFETDPAWSPQGNKIAYSSGPGGDFDIYIMDPDGSNKERLTDCPGECAQPSWSPTGESIAYVSGTGETGYDLYVMEADGSGSRRLVSGGLNQYPAWSPDDLRIAFTRSVDYSSRGYLYLVNPDGTGLVSLTGDLDWTRRFSWSPDSRFIVFENARGSGWSLWIIDVLSQATWLLYPASYIYAPAWSPILTFNPAEINALPDCTSGWTRLVVGGQARVMGAPTDPSNRVRLGPGKADEVIGQVSPGTILQVLEGPVCADGLVFWKVANTIIPGGSGWTAEGDGIEYYLEPYYP